MSEIFYDVAGAQKKQWVYGIGRKRAATMPSTTSCSSSASIDQLRADIYQQIQDEDERVQKIQDEMQQMR